LIVHLLLTRHPKTPDNYHLHCLFQTTLVVSC